MARAHSKKTKKKTKKGRNQNNQILHFYLCWQGVDKEIH